MNCSMHRIAMAAPDDLSGLRRLVDHGRVVAADVVAVLGKTEGNGCVNDFSRGLAVRELGRYFRTLLGEDAGSKVLLIMSGGTEGVLSPHFTVICRTRRNGSPKRASRDKSLSVGVARTPSIAPEDLGRASHVRLVADAVRTALVDAEIRRDSDAHFVQIKCPLLTTESIADAASRGAKTVTDDTYKSMAFSRGASALGAAVALGEVDSELVTDEMICSQWDQYSSVASASAGGELKHCEVLVLGNSAAADGDLVVGHEVMRDAIDVGAVQRAAASVGCKPVNTSAELVQVFAKAEADPSGVVRSRRHTMLSDSDINHTRHARAVVGGVVAAFFGDPMVYVSGGAEHQGPSGGGPIAIVARRVDASRPHVLT
jgi:cyanuric acid amidohydrolase